MMRSFYALFLLIAVVSLLSGCTSVAAGPAVTDNDGNSYRKVQTTTEYYVLCNGSCKLQE